MILCVAAVSSLGGCGAGTRAPQTAAASPPATASSSSATKRSPPVRRLATATAYRVTAVCRHGESSEDVNVAEQFASHGAAILSPQVQHALGAAAGDTRREAARLRAPDPPLAVTIDAQSAVMRQAATLHGLARSPGVLLMVLRRRIAIADASGVPRCAGATVSTLPPG